MVFGRKRKVVPFRSAGELDAMAAASAATGERGADELLADMVTAAYAQSPAGQR